MAKKFNVKSLNAVNAAIDTISEAIEEPVVVLGKETPSAALQPEVANTGTETSVETVAEAVSTEKTDAPSSLDNLSGRVGERPSAPTPSKKKSPKAKKSEADETKEDLTPLNILIPDSVYRRLSMMKIDTRKSLKDLTVEAVLKMLDKNGY